MRGINIGDLQSLYRPDAVAQVIINHTTTGLTALDRFFPNRVRRRWDSPRVPVEEIQRVTKAVPMVRRGTPGFSIVGDSGAMSYFVPQPVKPYDVLSATDFNDMQILRRISRQEYANNKTRKMIDTVRHTANALAAQAITGTIDWLLYSDLGGIVGTAEFKFGDILSFSVSADWTHANTKIETILKDLIRAERVLRKKGFTRLRVIVGEDIYTAVSGKVAVLPNDTRIDAKITKQGDVKVVIIGGYELELEAGQYWKPDMSEDGGAYKDVLGAKELCMYAEDAPWTFLWVKLDNFKLRNQALPFGIVPAESKDGAYIELFGTSKPFPIAPVNAILRTDATQTA